MAPTLTLIPLLFLAFLQILGFNTKPTAATDMEGNWCVARSDASTQALQRALDYACGTGADCTPIQADGLCFLPNNIQAHASYAFNSYYQRKAMAPGSCDFAGTANIASTDPSYGSCVYPSSFSTAGGTTPASTTNPNVGTTPTTPTTTPAYNGGTPGLNPGTTPSLPTDNSEASLRLTAPTIPLSLSLMFLLERIILRSIALLSL